MDIDTSMRPNEDGEYGVLWSSKPWPFLPGPDLQEPMFLAACKKANIDPIIAHEAFKRIGRRSDQYAERIRHKIVVAMRKLPNTPGWGDIKRILGYGSHSCAMAAAKKDWGKK